MLINPLRPIWAVFIMFFAVTDAMQLPGPYLVCRDPKYQLCISWPIKYEDAVELVKTTMPGSDLAERCGFSSLIVISPQRREITVNALHPGMKDDTYCPMTSVLVSLPYKEYFFKKQDKVVLRNRRQTIAAPRGRFRGQTQSQYLAIDRGNSKDEGKAEAHSAADSSRASVSGNSGMGQAQSQTMYDPTCDDCVGRSETEVENLRRPHAESGGVFGSSTGPRGNGVNGPHQNGYGPGGIKGENGNYWPGQNGGFGGGGTSSSIGNRPGQDFAMPGGSYRPSQVGLPGSGIPNGPSHGGVPVGGSFSPQQGGVSGFGVPGHSGREPGSSGSYGNGQTGAPGGGDTYGISPGGVPGGRGSYGNGQAGAPVGGEPYGIGQVGVLGARGSYGNGQVGAPVGGEPYGIGQVGVPGGRGSYGSGQVGAPIGSEPYGIGQGGVPAGRGSYGNGQGAAPVGGEPYGIGQGGVPGGRGSYGNGQGAAPVGGEPYGIGQGGVPGGRGSYGPGLSSSPDGQGSGTFTPVQGAPVNTGAYGPVHRGGTISGQEGLPFGTGQNGGSYVPSQGVPGSANYGHGQPSESYRPSQTNTPGGLGGYGPGHGGSPSNTPGVGGQNAGPIGGTGTYGPGQDNSGPGQGVLRNTVYGTNGSPSVIGSFRPGQTDSGGSGSNGYGPSQGLVPGGSNDGISSPSSRGYETGQGFPSTGGIPSGDGSYKLPGSNAFMPDGTNWPIRTGSFPTASGPAYYCCVTGPNNKHELFAVGNGRLQPVNTQGSQMTPGQYSSTQGGQRPYDTGSSAVPNNLMGPAYGTGNTVGGVNGLTYGPNQGTGSAQAGPNGQLGPGTSYGNGISGNHNGLPSSGFNGEARPSTGQSLGGNGLPGSLSGSGGMYGPGTSGGPNGISGPGGQSGPGSGSGLNSVPGTGGPFNTASTGGPNGMSGPGGQYGPGNSNGQNGLPVTNGSPNGMSGPGGQYGPGNSNGQNGLPVTNGPYYTGSTRGSSVVPGGQYSTGPSNGQNGISSSGGPYNMGATGGQNGIPVRQYPPGSNGGQNVLGAGVPYNAGSTGGQNGIYAPGGIHIPGPANRQNGVSGAGDPYSTGSSGAPNGISGSGVQYGPGSSGGQNGLIGAGGPYSTGSSGSPNGVSGSGGQYGPGGSSQGPNNLISSGEPYGTGQNAGPGGSYGSGVTGDSNGLQTGPYGTGGVSGPYGIENPASDHNGLGSQGLPGENGNYGQGGSGIHGTGAVRGQNGLPTGPYSNGMPGETGGQNGPYGLGSLGNAGQDAESPNKPQNVVDPNSIASLDGDDSEAEASVNQAANGTIATAASKGGNDKGRAQTHVHGAYTGSGSFSAQAEISGENKAANSEVSGDKKGASSSAQGSGRNNKSQANVQLGSETGSVLTGSQSEGSMHSSNTQVQGSIKGGMADAQARGPGSTSSQAQIGFTPFKEGDKSHESQKNPYVGGGTASAQSSGRTGTSQSQLHGTFKYGISYNGAAQAGASVDKDAVFPNRLSFDKIDVYDESNKNINVTEDNKQIPEILPDSFPASTYSPPDISLTTVLPEEETVKPVDNDLGDQSDHTHSDHHKQDIDTLAPTRSPPEGSRRSFPIAYNPVPPEYEFTTDKDDGQPDEYDVDDGFGPENNDSPDVEQTDYNEYSRDNEQTHQSLHSPNRKGLEVRQTTGGNTQHILLGSLNGHDAKITQKTSERPDESRIYQPGESIPGTGGYTIPIGFTGSVKSVASKDNTYVIGSKDYPSQAQTVSLTPGNGKIRYTYPSSYGKSVNRKDLRSLHNSHKDDNNRYVSVSKSVTRSLDGENNIRKQYSHTYYTKSSSCGYFTFTCTIVSGSEGRKKVCKPKVPTNPDGSPMRC